MGSLAAWAQGCRSCGEELMLGAKAAVALIYYFTELLLSDKGSLRSRRLASTEHIFNMNHSRNNKNMKWLIKGPFHKGPA